MKKSLQTENRNLKAAAELAIDAGKSLEKVNAELVAFLQRLADQDSFAMANCDFMAKDLLEKATKGDNDAQNLQHPHMPQSRLYQNGP